MPAINLESIPPALQFIVCWLIVVAIASFVCALSELAQYFRRQTWTGRPRKSGIPAAKPQWEYSMKKRIIMIGALAAVFAAIGFSTGCASWRDGESTFGNGQIDLPVNVTFEWHDNFGNGFTLVDGTVTEITYKSVKTGVLYELTDTGGFCVTAPDGVTTVRIQRKTETTEETDTAEAETVTTEAEAGTNTLSYADQQWLNQMALDLEELKAIGQSS